jgi:hypothetical protein
VRGRDGRRLIVPGGSGPGSGAGHSLGVHSHDKQGSMGAQGAGVAPGGGAPGTNTGSASNSNKAVVCPSCSKPLPRCAICLLHLGVPAEGNAALGPWSSLGRKSTGKTVVNIGPLHEILHEIYEMTLTDPPGYFFSLHF